MGFTYQELKRTKKNSIVLEKQENIEIQQNSAGFFKTKRTLKRERFFDRPHNTHTFNGCHEDKVWQKDMKVETEEKPRTKKYHQKDKIEKTWADHLANNNGRERMQDELQVAKEKFSLQHKCICISPRYANDEDLKPRPRMRSVGSQDTARKKCLDQGALGDRSSCLNSKLETGNKSRDIKELFKADSSRITKKDHAVNCYYSRIEQPLCQNCANCRVINNGSTCQHQIGLDCHSRQYTYCCDEYYYDCGNCRCDGNCAGCHNTARSAHQNRRQRTDLNTEHFYCQPINKTCANEAFSKRKTKTVTKTKELNAESVQHKKREGEMRKEQRNKRRVSKSKEAEEKKTIKEERFLAQDKLSEILKYLDRYIDDQEIELKLRTPNRKAKLYQDAVNKNRQDSQQDPNTPEAVIKSNGSVPQQPVYSLETVEMLKQMKIYEYKPRRAREQIEENKLKRETVKEYKQQEKEEIYQRYLEMYKKENEANSMKIKVLKNPSKTWRKQESEEPITYRSGKDQKEVSREYVLKQESIQVNKDKTNFYYNQNSAEDFQNNNERDKSNLGYVEEHIHSSGELSCKPDEPKRSVESELSQLEVAIADLKHHRHMTNGLMGTRKKSTNCTDDYEQVKGKEENTTKPVMTYDHNKVRDTTQKQPENILTEDQYVDKTFQQSGKPYNPLEFQSKSSDNGHGFQGSIGSKSDIRRESIQHESVRERRSKEINEQHESKETKEKTPKKISEQYGCESEEKNDDTINDEHFEIYREKEKEKRSSLLQSVGKQAIETLNFPDSYGKVTNDEALQQKEDKEIQLNRSLNTKFTIKADTNQEVIATPAVLVDHKFYPLEKKNDNFLIQKPQEYDAKAFEVLEQKSHSSTYNDFKQVMDHNLGVFVSRSSQTEDHINTELNVPVSKETFNKELNPEEEISDRHCTLAEALKYLENFLKFSPQPTKDDHCSNPVISPGNDLVTKLSSSKTSLFAHQLLASPEDLKKSTHSSGDRSNYTIEQKITQDTQYKDPKSSDLQIQQLTRELENVSTLAENKDIEPQLERKQNSFLSTATIKPELESSHVIQDTQLENTGKELATNEFVEPESYDDKTPANLQQRQSSEIYQRYQPYKENPYNLKQLAEYNNGHDTHCKGIYKQQEQQQCCESYTASQQLFKDLSSSSRQADVDSNLMPSNSSLKSCCTMGTPQEFCCDSQTYKIESEFSFYPKDEINIKGQSLMQYGQLQEETGEKIYKNTEGIIAKDSISKQSNLKLTESQNQPIYTQYQLDPLEPQSVLAHYGAQNNSPISCSVEAPAFEQCPCMWETYMEMVRNFYKGKQKQLIIDS